MSLYLLGSVAIVSAIETSQIMICYWKPMIQSSCNPENRAVDARSSGESGRCGESSNGYVTQDVIEASANWLEIR